MIEALVKWIIKPRGRLRDKWVTLIFITIAGTTEEKFGKLFEWNYFVTRSYSRALFLTLRNKSLGEVIAFSDREKL